MSQTHFVGDQKIRQGEGRGGGNELELFNIVTVSVSVSFKGQLSPQTSLSPTSYSDITKCHNPLKMCYKYNNSHKPFMF